MSQISCVLITKNEEKNILACLASAAFCSEFIVVDSGSDDSTRALAEAGGAKVFGRDFTGYAEQKNFGIHQACGDWIFLIDADERVSPELAKDILRAVSSSEADGYWVLRRNRLFGRWMSRGAHGKDYQLRLVRKGRGLFEGAVHERVRCSGKTLHLNGVLNHESTATLTAYMQKLNPYTSLEALELSKKETAQMENEMRRKPILKFFYDLAWRGGIWDGFEGFLFGVLSAYYDFIKRAKAWELRGRRDKISASSLTNAT